MFGLNDSTCRGSYSLVGEAEVPALQQRRLSPPLETYSLRLAPARPQRKTGSNPAQSLVNSEGVGCRAPPCGRGVVRAVPPSPPRGLPPPSPVPADTPLESAPTSGAAGDDVSGMLCVMLSTPGSHPLSVHSFDATSGGGGG